MIIFHLDTSQNLRQYNTLSLTGTSLPNSPNMAVLSFELTEQKAIECKTMKAGRKRYFEAILEAGSFIIKYQVEGSLIRGMCNFGRNIGIV